MESPITEIGYTTEQIWAKCTQENLQIIEEFPQKLQENLQQGLLGYNHCIVVRKKD